MFDEVNQAIEDYLGKWQGLVAKRKNREFFERLKLTSVGWKVADLAEYDRLFNLWRDACDQLHVVWLNDRWITTMHLKEGTLVGGITIIKLMQRRPDSSDAVGLDNLDFMDMEETNTKAVLAEETDLKWTDEKNGLCIWTSIWFEGTEAKLRLGTPIDVSIAELEAVNKDIRGKFIASPETSGVVTAELE